MSEITEAIQSYLADSEKIQTARADDESAIVVTDRRIMELERTEGESRRELRTLKSTIFTGNRVTGTEIVEVGEESPNTIKAAAGTAISLLAAFGFLQLMNLDSGGPETGIGAFILLIFIFTGGYLVYDALDTTDGHVTVKLTSTEGDTINRYVLSEEEADVGAAISKAVSATQS